MTPDDFHDHDDVGDAIREGRPLRRSREYRFRLAHGDLNFRTIGLADPVPLGRQILVAGGLSASPTFALAAILATGDFEDVRLDEPFDLRERRAERFVAFATDRLFRLTLNNAAVTWGKPAISGAVLHKLAGAGEADVVRMHQTDGSMVIIAPDQLIDLTQPGVETFSTGPRPLINITVNGKPREVRGPTVTFEQIVQLAYPGQPGPDTTYTMTFRHAASLPHAGELAAGGIVTVKEGTAFNVTPTVKS